MARNNIFYLLLLAGIFYGFISLLDANKVKADDLVNKVSYDVLRYQWVVAEAVDMRTSQDLTPQYQAVAYQFLSSGGFVEFEDRIIRNTGSWQVNQDRLQIQYDTSTDLAKVFMVEMLRPEEMVLQNDQLRIRLLRLQL